MLVLWPHAALDDHRSRAFVLPRGAEDTKKLEENRARLEALWRMSRSHGTSWDDLDAAFVAFAQTGKRRYAQWSRGKIKPDEKESGAEDKPPTGGFRGGFRGGAPVLDDRDLPTAALVKQHCEVRARKFIGQFCPQGQDPKFLFPSATRRLTARLYRQEKKKFLAPWAPGKLSVKLQQLVAARMCGAQLEDMDLELQPALRGEALAQAARNAQQSAENAQRSWQTREQQALRRSVLESELRGLEAQQRQHQTRIKTFLKEEQREKALTESLQQLQDAELQLGLFRLELDHGKGLAWVGEPPKDEEPSELDAFRSIAVQFDEEGALLDAEPHPALGLSKFAERAVEQQDFAILPTLVWNRLCDAGDAEGEDFDTRLRRVSGVSSAGLGGVQKVATAKSRAAGPRLRPWLEAMGWRDNVSPVEEASRPKSRSSLTLLRQSVTGFMGGSKDSSSPTKRSSWFSLSKPSSPAQTGRQDPAQRPTSPAPPAGGTAEEFAVASQLLEGVYGRRLDASQALDILQAVPEISWLVECYSMTPADPGWRKSKVAPGDAPLYADEATGKVYEAMPCIRHYMRLAECALNARQKKEESRAAADLQHHVQSLYVELRTTEAEWTGPHEDAESKGEYFYNPTTGVSTWERPTNCAKFIISVAETMLDSDAFPCIDPKERASSSSKDLVAGRVPKMRREDPWASLEKLEAMAPPRPQAADVDDFLGSLTQAKGFKPSPPEPVQLATSPKTSPKRIRDVRSWQPSVPRFDSAKLSEAVSPTRTVRGVAFRSTVEVEAKIDDVRSWQPEPEVVRWGSNEAQAAAPEPAERADADARTEVPSGSGGQGGSLREAAQVPQAPAPVPPSAAEAPLPP
ncbi:unnamed protein product [Effrenium voratum]|nr:unnamed protein product [Effrenium voratum]